MEMYPRILRELVTDPLGYAKHFGNHYAKPTMYYGSWTPNQDSKKCLYEEKV
jgi:hypothetical protein